MSSEKARARRRRLYAWVMFAIMFGGVFTAGGIALFGGKGGSAQPSPTPPPPPAFQRNLSSFTDALDLVPADALRVVYSNVQGAYGSDLGGFINQRHTLWSQTYGSTVTAEVRILLPGGVPLWLHTVAGSAPRAPPAFTYRNASIVEFFPGRQPWFGIVTNSQPLVAGVRPPGRPGPPYLAGLDELLDVTEGKANRTSSDLFGDLARRLPRESQFALASAVSAQGWDNRSVFGVLSQGNENYLAQAYLEGRSPNATLLESLRANATALGARLLWNREAGAVGELVRIEALGNWSQVRDILAAGGLLTPDA